MAELEAKGASLRVLEPEIGTGGDIGRIVITTLGMVAELERSFLRERQRAGIVAATARGAYKGRRKSVDPSAIASLIAQGLGPTAIAQQLGISRMTVYRETAGTKAAALQFSRSADQTAAMARVANRDR